MKLQEKIDKDFLPGDLKLHLEEKRKRLLFLDDKGTPKLEE